MPLRFKGVDKGVSWVFLDAVSDSGDRVLVKVSHEAHQKYGPDAAREAAQRKHAYRLLEPDGTVLVLSMDCAGRHLVRALSSTAEARA
jgi:hypothetical protein